MICLSLKKNLREKIIFCWHLQDHWRREQDPDLDPYVSGTDPRIRNKMSRIHNTNVQTDKFDIDNFIFCSDSLPDLLNFVY